MNTVTIRFSDETEIIAEQNGTAYITDEPISLPDDLSILTITSDDGNEITLYNVKFIECASIDGRFWFSFIERTEDEMWKAAVEDAIVELMLKESE